jgi:hypothetical protein
MNRNPIYSISKRIVDKYNLVCIRKAYEWEQRQVRSLKTYWAMIPERPKLRQLKNLHAGQKRCFIIGNGPSIRQQDLTKLKNEIVFVTNSFVHHDQYNEINPTYYCVTIDLIKYNDFDTDWYPLMLERTANTPKFFSLPTKSFVRKHNLFVNHPIFYLNCVDIPIWETKSMSLDITKEVHYGNTLIIDFCLPLAFYMGFSKIYLLGCDCDYKLDEAEDLSKGYFYNIPRVPDQQSLEDHGEPWYEKVTTSYSVAREVFEANGRKIYNAGFGGKLEIFERVNYDSLF